ncbi:MAG: hypothetical protein IPK39_13195 [Sulfuritalea sp.]|nr:hypothetical protein [Sulfuritalea sp.]
MPGGSRCTARFLAPPEIASLNILLSSARLAPGQQCGFSHRDPGPVEPVMNKEADIIRVLSAAGRQHTSPGHRASA